MTLRHCCGGDGVRLEVTVTVSFDRSGLVSGALVSQEVSALVGAVVALVAAELALLRVRALVLGATRVVCKALRAVRALERPLARVSAHVHCQRALLLERLGAVWTGKATRLHRAFLRMCSEHSLLGERVSADGADELLRRFVRLLRAFISNVEVWNVCDVMKRQRQCRVLYVLVLPVVMGTPIRRDRSYEMRLRHRCWLRWWQMLCGR